jgi:3-methyladenine DNA glycosylase AlkD
MSHEAFELFLDSAPKSEGYEVIGRTYKNAFGVDETIILHKNYWDYVDWLVENGIDIQEWITECDKYRDDKPLSENFMEWLYWDECERHRSGTHTPTDNPPLGYQE